MKPGIQMRMARPTDRVEEVVRFHRDGLGSRSLEVKGLPGVAERKVHPPPVPSPRGSC